MAPRFSFIRATAVLALVFASTEAYADPVKGDVRVTTESGYARIVFRMAEDVTAKVTFISRTSEFTPPVIYSLDERSKLVFLIEARTDTPGELRVGQPADVRFAEPRK